MSVMNGMVVRRVERDVERVVAATPGVLVGAFRCPTDYADFRTAGRIQNYVVAFPRTAVWIRREHARPFVADPAVATVYSPGQAYERAMISRHGDVSDWFAVSEPIARELVEIFDARHALTADPAALFRHACAPVSAGLYYRQRRLFERLGAGADAMEAMDVEESVIGIVRDVLEAAYTAAGDCVRARRERARAVRDVVDGAKEAMMRSLFENTSVTALAAELGVSPFYLCRVFRAKTGATLHEYRREMRLRVALGLAPSYRGNLSHLAVELGFYSHSHFTAAFHKSFGANPSSAAARI